MITPPPLASISIVINESKVEKPTINLLNNLDECLAETSSTKENDSIDSTSLNGDVKHVNNVMAATYALGIIRNAAWQIPSILDYFAENHPQMIVKTSLLLNNKEINTLKMSEYHKNVNASYLNGTFRYGPLLQTSIVGIRNEEIGDYFPEFIHDHLERSPFLCPVMPWGSLSILENMNPMNSDDGPIIWARPGEQMIPTSSLKDQQLNSTSNISANPSPDKRKK